MLPLYGTEASGRTSAELNQATNDAGVYGMVFIALGLLGAAITGPVLDHTHAYKTVLKAGFVVRGCRLLPSQPQRRVRARGRLLLPRHSRARFVEMVGWMALDDGRWEQLPPVLHATSLFRQRTQLADWGADERVQSITLKIKYYDVMLTYLEDIIKQVNNRSYMIKNIIDWHIFRAG